MNLPWHLRRVFRCKLRNAHLDECPGDVHPLQGWRPVGKFNDRGESAIKCSARIYPDTANRSSRSKSYLDGTSPSTSYPTAACLRARPLFRPGPPLTSQPPRNINIAGNVLAWRRFGRGPTTKIDLEARESLTLAVAASSLRQRARLDSYCSKQTQFHGEQVDLCRASRIWRLNPSPLSPGVPAKQFTLQMRPNITAAVRATNHLQGGGDLHAYEFRSTGGKGRKTCSQPGKFQVLYAILAAAAVARMAPLRPAGIRVTPAHNKRGVSESGIAGLPADTTP